jgi:hypothetical protein
VTVLDEIDQLYELAVTSPAALTDQMVEDWTDSVAVGYEIDRVGAKYIRRCVNAARKLAVFWRAWDSEKDCPEEWPSRVDLALGVRAWRPELELAQHLLAASSDEATYLKAAQLFRIVNNEPFLDGMTYESWLEASHS